MAKRRVVGITGQRLLVAVKVLVACVVLGGIAGTAVRFRDKAEMNKYVRLLRDVGSLRPGSTTAEQVRLFASTHQMAVDCRFGRCVERREFQSWLFRTVRSSPRYGEVMFTLMHNSFVNWLGIRPWYADVELVASNDKLQESRFFIDGEAPGHREFGVIAAYCAEYRNESECVDPPGRAVDVSISGGFKSWHATVPVRVTVSASASPSQVAEAFNVGFGCITALIPCRTYREVYPLTRTDEPIFHGDP